MAVEARMYVQTITHHAVGTGQVRLNAVSRGPENKEWAAATPSGSVDMMIGSPAALEFFTERLGKDLVVTFQDRPLVCGVCRKELTQDQHASASVVVTDENKARWPEARVGDVVHYACSVESRTSR